ncbi:MAG: hypothetical protein IT457_04515 [Planctomycetes bacterium]|nr:hypothetical protein [Planctomycetota bacterium]
MSRLRWIAATLLAAAATGSGCGDEPSPALDAPVPAPTRLDAMALVDAILVRSHGPRRGSFDRAIVYLRETADGQATTVSYALPDRARIVTPDGRWTLCTKDAVSCSAPDGSSAPAPAESRTSCDLLLRALDAITLQPLERLAGARHLDEDELELTTRNGERWILEHDPAAHAALALRGPSIAVRFLEHHDSGRTRIPLVVEVEGLGVRRLYFVDTGVEFGEQVFAPPGSAGDGARTVVVGGEARLARPRLLTVDAGRWLMAKDPGDWAGRMRLFRAAGERLAPLGYGNGGDPFLLTDELGDWFVVPFVALVAEAPAVALEDGERDVPVESHRVASVDAAPGAWDARIAGAGAALESFAKERGVRITGPRRIALNLLGADPSADASAASSLPMRVSVPIAKGD